MAQRRWAVIVGASSGIGAALARELAARGYTLALIARNEAALERLSAEITQRSPDETAPVARVYAHDVRDYDAVPPLFQRITDELGPEALDLVVYCAGIMPEGKDEWWTFEQERAMIETNVVGAMRWLDLAAGYFREKGRGTLVGISSVAGDRGRHGNGAYQASKAALSTYLESLRYRLHGTAVRVVTVKPGYVATPMTAGRKMPGGLVISPERAARRIADVCEGRQAVVYVPGYWRPIMWGVRHLPAWLMARVPF
jgi:short-subunit dehydrogenase